MSCVLEALFENAQNSAAPCACPVSENVRLLSRCTQNEEQADEKYISDRAPDSFLREPFRGVLQIPVIPFRKHTSQSIVDLRIPGQCKQDKALL